MEKTERINSSFGEIVIYNGYGNDNKFKAKINSSVKEDIVGLDLMDGCSINFLSHIDNIEFITPQRSE